MKAVDTSFLHIKVYLLEIFISIPCFFSPPPQCLAAGSSIMNRESESSAMRPLAKALTKALENVRNLLREQCLRGNASSIGGMNELFGERLQEALKIFDRLFAEFELCYVSAMVPVKSTQEYELQQFVVVLFSETLQRYSSC